MKDIHENSTRSLDEQKSCGKVTHFRKAIFDLLAARKVPMTDREIMDVLEESDVNNVRPEITRLKQDGLIMEAGKVQCHRTHKTVRRTIINSTVYMDRKTRIKK